MKKICKKIIVAVFVCIVLSCNHKEKIDSKRIAKIEVFAGHPRIIAVVPPSKEELLKEEPRIIKDKIQIKEIVQSINSLKEESVDYFPITGISKMYDDKNKELITFQFNGSTIAYKGKYYIISNELLTLLLSK